MQQYVKVYLKARGLDETSFVPCLVCGCKSDEIHHLLGRGKGRTNDLYNLIAVCRSDHNYFHNHNTLENRERGFEIVRKDLEKYV